MDRLAGDLFCQPTARLKIYFDGGCRPEPGTMELAVVAGGQVTVVADAGHGTSQDAEWLALIHAAEIARSLNRDDLVLIGDSADVIAKASGRLRCHGRDAEHLAHLRAVLPPGVGLRWVRRAQNLAGIALAKRHPR